MLPEYSRYCRPSDIKQPTWTLTSGTAVTGYEPSHLGDKDPAWPLKTTGTSATARATFGSTTTLVGAVIPPQHNLAGASSVKLTSPSGLDQTFVIPANTGGQANISILDFSSATLSQRQNTIFDLVVTTNVLGNIAIGEVLLIGAWRDLKWIWGLKWKPRRLVVNHSTFGASQLQYNKRIRIHEGRGLVKLKTEEDALRILEEEAEGGVHPWLIVSEPYAATPFGVYGKFAPDTFEWVFRSIGSTEIPIEFIGLSPGPPLFA